MRNRPSKNRGEKLGTKEDYLKDKAAADATPKGEVPKIDRAFIREKKVGRFHYRYLVKKYRIKGKVVQKVLKYLGR